MEDEVRIISHAQMSMHKKVQIFVKKLDRKTKSLTQQQDHIKSLKEDVNTISGHVCAHTLWQGDANDKLAMIPEIRDGQAVIKTTLNDIFEALSVEKSPLPTNVKKREK